MQTPPSPAGQPPAPSPFAALIELGRARNEFFKTEGVAVVLRDSNKPHALLNMTGVGGLRPSAQTVMAALSQWALPRGTSVELNRDAYIQPEPLERAQTAQILAGIVDPVTGRQALTVDEIRAAERLDDTTPTNVAQGVLRG